MSENLTQLARKIDFATDGEDVTCEEKKDEEEEEEKQPFQQPHWPLEDIRNKIRYVVNSGLAVTCRFIAIKTNT